jgi:hypothetical protein
MVRMPDRASLAAASALAAADVYRQIGCDYYAMRLQEYLLTHYAVTLGTERRRQISRTLAELRDLLGPEPPEGDEDLPGHDWVQVRSIGASTWDPTDADHAGETLAEFLDSLHRPSVAAGELSLPTQPGEVGLPDGEPMPPAGRAGATSVSRPSEVADPGQTESFEPTDPVTPRPAGGPVAPGESAR